jgi:hypothetical protein
MPDRVRGRQRHQAQRIASKYLTVHVDVDANAST